MEVGGGLGLLRWCLLVVQKESRSKVGLQRKFGGSIEVVC